MDIYRNTDKTNDKNSVLALGNFDGVHTGHTQLLKAAKSLASQIGASAGVYTFAVNSKILLGTKDFSLLTTDREKNEIFDKLGMDFICYDDFSAIKDFSPEQFCNYLTEKFNLSAVVCGENYTFGKFACAGSRELEAIMTKKGVKCLTVQNFVLNGTGVSSTAIRKHISDGNIDLANEMLGYCYFIDTEVIHGAALGRKLGFPTINQHFYSGKAVPAFGVYACKCTVDSKLYYGVANVGVKPTVSKDSENPEVVAETNIIDFDGDLYGKSIRVEFCKMLRREKKFPSLDALRDGVLKNIEETRIYFGKDCK